MLCIRITYLGELGYELHIPAEQAVHVYDRLVEAGRELGLRHAGLKALSSLRMEKGYRDYGHDIDNTDTVLEAGLGFAVALDKPGGFIGRDAVAAQKAAGPLTRRLVQVLLTDPEPLLFHAEIVRRDGARGRLHPGRVLRLDARRRGRPGDGRIRRRADRPGLAGRRRVDRADRRPDRPGPGVAAAVLRPGQQAHQDVSGVACGDLRSDGARTRAS